MERLTEKNLNWENPNWIDDEFWTSACEPDDAEIDEVYRKLKAYEDTGLTPAEITERLSPPENKPLTLEELREMDGEPVWVELIEKVDELGFWALVEVCREKIYLINHIGWRRDYIDDDDLRDDGLCAYRRKPEVDKNA